MFGSPRETAFLPLQGDVHALTAGAGAAPVLAAQAAPLRPLQLTTLSHRLPLYSAVTPEASLQSSWRTATCHAATSCRIPAHAPMSAMRFCGSKPCSVAPHFDPEGLLHA